MTAVLRMLLFLLAVAVTPVLAQEQRKEDAEELLSAVVQVKAKILPNARSLATLGPQRRGSGVLVREGYVLTIGYLVIEAEAIEVAGADGKVVPATLAAYDHASGFGLLKPILEDLIAKGHAPGPLRPWLGVNVEELRGRLFVVRVSPEGPAERAGMKSGDLVIGVGGEEVASLAEFYRKVWSRGAAGVEVPLRVLQGVQVKDVSVRSIDRLQYFRQKSSY